MMKYKTLGFCFPLWLHTDVSVLGLGSDPEVKAFFFTESSERGRGSGDYELR